MIYLLTIFNKLIKISLDKIMVVLTFSIIIFSRIVFKFYFVELNEKKIH